MEVRSVYAPVSNENVEMANKYYNSRKFNTFTFHEAINTGNLMRQNDPWIGMFNHFTVQGFQIAPKAKSAEPSWLTGTLGFSMPRMW
jgi:hypothetical protein